MSVGGQCEVKNGQCDLGERKKGKKRRKEGRGVKVYGRRSSGCEYEEKEKRKR